MKFHQKFNWEGLRHKNVILWAKVIFEKKTKLCNQTEVCKTSKFVKKKTMSNALAQFSSPFVVVLDVILLDELSSQKIIQTPLYFTT